MKTTSDAVQIMHAMMGNDPEMWVMVKEEREKRRVASLIYEARTAAGLTQAELAACVGTRQSAIARLEDADYEGHTLTMLASIAGALDYQVEVRFVRPASRRPSSRRPSSRKADAITA